MTDPFRRARMLGEHPPITPPSVLSEAQIEAAVERALDEADRKAALAWQAAGVGTDTSPRALPDDSEPLRCAENIERHVGLTAAAVAFGLWLGWRLVRR